MKKFENLSQSKFDFRIDKLYYLLLMADYGMYSKVKIFLNTYLKLENCRAILLIKVETLKCYAI